MLVAHSDVLTAAPRIRMAEWAEAAKRSPMQDMLALTTRPGLIQFGLGLPNRELFPRETLASLVPDLLLDDAQVLQYGPATLALKEAVCDLMKERGVACRPEQVFLTTGAQQAINLLSRVLVEPGAPVLMEELTYTGFLQVLEPYRPQMLTVPTCPTTGIDVEAVEAHLQAGVRPAFLYCISDGHNPLGISLPQAKREKLVELARMYQMPIIEDDPYGFLAYETERLAPMRALDEDWVLYCGSFSKILAPGMRVGWMLVPDALQDKLSIAKEASDINTATWSQHAVARFLHGGHLPAHIEVLRREYRLRRDVMAAAIREHFPAGTQFEVPANGMFIWVQVPAGYDAIELLPRAVDEAQVAYFPGQAFAASPTVDARRTMRLNFSNSTVEQIQDGIAALGHLMK